MPERRCLERHKLITDDDQQCPWQLLNRIQYGVCAPYVFSRIVRLMCKKPNGAYMATAAAAPRFGQLLPQPVKTTFPKLRSPYLGVNSGRPSGDISVFIVGSFKCVDQ